MGVLINPSRFGAGGPSGPVVTDLFDIDLYTGDGTTSRSISSIDLSGGGLAWIKSRSASQSHGWIYTPNGASPQLLASDSIVAGSAANATFSGAGFNLTDATFNVSARTYVAWAMKRAARFMDVVTYTGNGANRTIAHGLGRVPAMIIIKRTNASGVWACYHRGLGNGSWINLSNASASIDPTAWNSTDPTSSVFSLGTYAQVNNSGDSYVAYLFAHDTDPDGVIQGFTYTGNGSATGPVVTLGWQPQYVLFLPNGNTDRTIIDTTRTPGFTGDEAILFATKTNAETSGQRVDLVTGGFQLKSAVFWVNGNGTTYYGLAIRAP